MTARDELLACLDELIAGCRAGTPGGWRPHGNSVRHEAGPFVTLAITAGDRKYENAAHIAAHSPDRTRALYEGLRAEVDGHKPKRLRAAKHVDNPDYICPSCCCDLASRDAPCPFVSRVASWLGSIEELIEASSLGEPDAVAARASVSDEQVAPIMERHRADLARPPSAGAATPHAEGSTVTVWLPEITDDLHPALTRFVTAVLAVAEAENVSLRVRVEVLGTPVHVVTSTAPPRHVDAIADTGEGFTGKRGYCIECLWCDWHAVRPTKAEAVAAYREHERAAFTAEGHPPPAAPQAPERSEPGR